MLDKCPQVCLLPWYGRDQGKIIKHYFLTENCFTENVQLLDCPQWSRRSSLPVNKKVETNHHQQLDDSSY